LFLERKHFGKRHDTVLRAFDRLDCGDEYRLRNFAETITLRPNPKGGTPIPSRVVQMTKNGFIWLAMGFRGKKAAEVKLGYIDAFDVMAESTAANRRRR